MTDRIKTLKKALEKDPTNKLGLFGLANEYFKEGMYKEAIETLEKYLTLHEDEGSAYRVLAQSYINLGEIEKAIQTYEKGIQQALKYNHSTMAQEFRQEIDQLKMML
ncbi:MAG: tetratricopeptide repeat protein [Aquificae bacterium]|nr:tetratricopeptide repeat protein [Aquificota bacterium]